MSPETEVAPFLEDASGYRGSADRVIVPGSLQEVQEVAKACSEQSIPLTIAGAGTGLTGARVPQSGWVLSLEKFRSIQIENGRAICGASANLNDLQTQAARTQQFFGPNPTEMSASIGGVISTNAGGARSFHYGSLRRHVLALEVTFVDGRTVRLQRGDRFDSPYQVVRQPATTKNAAGYFLQPDLQWVDLLAGSEGTLAIITEAELQLMPEPAAILSGVIFFSSDEQALDAVDAWRDVPDLRLLEYMDEASLQFLRSSYPEIPSACKAALLVEQNLASEEDPQVDEWLLRLQRQNAFADESWFGFEATDRERFRRFRHELAARVVDQTRRTGLPKCGTDFAVPLQNYRELHKLYRERCQHEFPNQYLVFGHIGDANNHLNILPHSLEEATRGEQVIHEFAAAAVSLGGTVGAEHGIGKNKIDLFRLMYDDAEIEAMRAVKRRLDPPNLLGRGTLFRD